MSNTRTHSLGLLLATVAWSILTGWLLLAPRDCRAWPVGARPSSECATQEPPAPPTIWSRVSARTKSLLNTPSDPRAEALARLQVPVWHAAGLRGKGVKVAVLDSGWKGYRDALGKVLPRTVTVRSFRKDGNLEARESQHGILCAELIHTLAPEAELLFANWEPETPSAFLDAVRWARQQGAKVISCSVIMPTWSDGEGGGQVHRELQEALNGAVFVASAGNTALRHWGGVVAPDNDGWHQWTRGRSDNAVRPLGQERVSVELTGGGDAVLEVSVVDTARKGERVAVARTPGAEGENIAVAKFEPAVGGRYAARVRQVRPAKGKAWPIHVTVLGGKLAHVTTYGSIPFPGDGAGVLAVGAVDEYGQRLAYSSCGAEGGSSKPNLCAVVPFHSRWRPEQPFAGTSSAAPQAAGLLALGWSREPRWSARQVQQWLMRHAKPVGKDKRETGAGIVRLPAS